MFGFSDVRKQIAAQGVIFLGAFFLLWLLHPAFAMVRSSIMILLGFIIMLIAGGLTILLSANFKENLADLRKTAGARGRRGSEHARRHGGGIFAWA